MQEQLSGGERPYFSFVGGAEPAAPWLRQDAPANQLGGCAALGWHPSPERKQIAQHHGGHLMRHLLGKTVNNLVLLLVLTGGIPTYYFTDQHMPKHDKRPHRHRLVLEA